MLPDKYFIDNLSNYFQQSNFLPKTSDTCIIILNYNNKPYILQLAQYLEKTDCDVLIVDNHSDDGSYEALLERYKERFNLIQTNDNLGGAGGFGIGIEWVVEKGYDYCFVSEEDALPLKGHEDIFDMMLPHRDPKKFVVAKFYELDTNSFNLHYTIYPTWILKEVGTVNMKLFFRADDQEWGMRIRTYLKRNGIRIENKVVDRYYTHPLIKPGFGLFANYFSMRNAFVVYLKYPNRNFLLDFFINFVKYSGYSLFTLFHDKNSAPLRHFIYAFNDFLFCKFENKKRIQMFRNDKLEPKEYHMRLVDFDTFHRKFSTCKVITSSMKNKHFKEYDFSGTDKKSSLPNITE